MFKHAIFTLLKEFSPSEIKKLESFLKSPYHNKSKKVKKLFDEIKKFYPDFESTYLSKKQLALKLNPFLKYNDSTIRDLISHLLRQIEEFLIFEDLNKSYPDKLFLLLKSYTEKNQDILFKKNLRKIANQLESGGIDSVYYYNKSLICIYNSSNIISYLKTTNSGLSWTEKKLKSLSTHYESLSIFFLTKNLGWIGGIRRSDKTRQNGETYQTINGGISWSAVTNGLNINRFRKINNSLVYAVGKRVYKLCKARKK